jgi:hypothetical protein
VDSYRTDKPVDYVAMICKMFLTGECGGNGHFFMNSVEMMRSVIDKANIDPKDVKLVCSTSREALIRNQEVLGVQYPIAQPSDPVKKLNFYTATAFEGCDIEDPEGRIFVVSDKNKKQTQVDISTTFIQICGRIRNTKYGDTITQIFSGTNYQEVSLEEYIASTQKAVDELKVHID